MISRIKVVFIFFLTLLLSLSVVSAQVSHESSINYNKETKEYSLLIQSTLSSSDSLIEEISSDRNYIVQVLYERGISDENINGLDDLGDNGALERSYSRYMTSFSSFTQEYFSEDFNRASFDAYYQDLSQDDREDFQEYLGDIESYQEGDWYEIDSASRLSLLAQTVEYDGDLNSLISLISDNQEQEDLQVQGALVDLLVNNPQLLAEFYSSEAYQDQVDQLLTNQNYCEGSIWNFYCSLKDKVTERDLFMDAYTKRINQIITQGGDVDTINSEIETETLSYLSTLTNGQCTDISNCLSTANSDTFCSSLDDVESCSTIKSIVRDIVRSQTENRLIEVDSVYFFVEGLLNPDRMGVNAARLFGFEDNYADLPAFIRDDLGSSMCIGKINGYLDKDVENGGGLSRYEVQNTSSDIIVTADIRAQRTTVDPENKTALTYSYFIRAPQDFGLTYVVALSYATANGTQKLTLENMQNISAGESANGFDNVAIPISDVDTLSKDSFTIGLLGVKSGTRSTHISLTYPVILIESGDRYYQEGAISNDEGHTQVTGTGSNDNTLEDSDMLDLLFT